MSATDQQLASMLDLLAAELDVPSNLREEAESRYTDLAEWIRKDSEDRYQVGAELYVQGSTRLGTMIRPIHEHDEFDIDLVYRRDLQRTSITQEGLMDAVGEQLARYIDHLSDGNRESPRLIRGQRCWTLQFEGRFHMDVLPALPDDDPGAQNSQNLEDAIIITDRDLREWQHSNPKGFAQWFDDRQAVQLVERKQEMAKAAGVEVEEIPASIVPTPLRRAIQLLKVHRDLRYEGSPDDKPASILITTLAARAYRGEQDALSAVVSLANTMGSYIEEKDGLWWVPNPIHHASGGENFADKWGAHPERAARFFEWLGAVNREISEAASQRGMENVASVLAKSFGESAVDRSMTRYAEQLYEQRDTGSLRMATGTGMLGTTGSTTVPPHTFFGRDEAKPDD